MPESEKWKGSRSVVSNSQRPHGLQPTRLLRPWDSPGKSTGAGCHCLCIGLAKKLFHKMVQKNLNESFGQPSISWVTCVYQYGLVDILHFGLRPNSTLLCCCNFSSYGHRELFQLSPVYIWHINIVAGFSRECPYSLALEGASGLSYISLAPVLELDIHPRSLGFIE